MRRPTLLVLLLASATLAACNLDEVVVPQGANTPVMHVVINPYEQEHITVLLERTLGGRIDARDTTFDPQNPIVSGGGEPITGATITMLNVTQPDTAVSIDLSTGRSDGKYRGVYAIPTLCRDGCISVLRKNTYTIRAELPTGEVVTGQTTIPEVISRPDTGLRRVFDAVNDRYVFNWPRAEDPRRYALQVQTPYGPFQTFAREESLAVSGRARNFQADRFPRVFVPGFIQALQAFAVDQNYFDYFRSDNDRFTGLGIINHLSGGTGVFGAVIPVRRQDLDVVAPFDEPVDGVWELEDSPDPSFPVRLTTWADGAFASGKLQDPYAEDAYIRRSVLGTRMGSRMRLDVLRYQDPRDAVRTMDAEVRGDTLFTTSAEHGAQRWRRRPDLQR